MSRPGSTILASWAPDLRPLADLQTQLLQGAGGAGLHFHGANAAPLEIGDGAEAAHLRVLQRQLRVGGLGHHLKPLLLDLESGGQLLDVLARPARIVGGDQLFHRQRLGGFGIPLGVEICRARLGDGPSWLSRWVARFARRFTRSACATVSWRSDSSA